MYDQNGRKFRLFQDEGKLVARSLPSPIVQSEEEYWKVVTGYKIIMD
jgi:hypothetical protein